MQMAGVESGARRHRPLRFLRAKLQRSARLSSWSPSARLLSVRSLSYSSLAMYGLAASFISQFVLFPLRRTHRLASCPALHALDYRLKAAPTAAPHLDYSPRRHTTIDLGSTLDLGLDLYRLSLDGVDGVDGVRRRVGDRGAARLQGGDGGAAAPGHLTLLTSAVDPTCPPLAAYPSRTRERERESYD